jgi:hypothetical protein
MQGWNKWLSFLEPNSMKIHNFQTTAIPCEDLLVAKVTSLRGVRERSPTGNLSLLQSKEQNEGGLQADLHHPVGGRMKV